MMARDEALPLVGEAGILLKRAEALGAVQVDAASDLIARVAPLVEQANDDEVREDFLPGLLGALVPFRDGGFAAAGVIVAELEAARDVGPDELRSAVASAFLTMSGKPWRVACERFDGGMND